MSYNYGVQNYLNTLIFCVVAKTITILVLGLLIFEPVRKYVMFLLTIELGLVVVIIYAMRKISSYNKRMAQDAEQLRLSTVNSVACPDFFTRGVGEEGYDIVCKNEYNSPDGKTQYRFIAGSQSTIDVIPVDEMFRKKTLEDACKMVNVDGSDAYASIPWTDLKSKCDII